MCAHLYYPLFTTPTGASCTVGEYVRSFRHKLEREQNEQRSARGQIHRDLLSPRERVRWLPLCSSGAELGGTDGERTHDSPNPTPGMSVTIERLGASFQCVECGCVWGGVSLESECCTSLPQIQVNCAKH